MDTSTWLCGPPSTILHIIVIPAYRELGVRRVALHPILAGPNNAIRVLNVFERLP